MSDQESLFAVGDVVRLKSGGPDMSVKHVSDDAVERWSSGLTVNYTCQWFAGKKLESGLFAGPTLERVTNGDS